MAVTVGWLMRSLGKCYNWMPECMSSECTLQISSRSQIDNEHDHTVLTNSASQCLLHAQTAAMQSRETTTGPKHLHHNFQPRERSVL